MRHSYRENIRCKMSQFEILIKSAPMQHLPEKLTCCLVEEEKSTPCTVELAAWINSSLFILFSKRFDISKLSRRQYKF